METSSAIVGLGPCCPAGNEAFLASGGGRTESFWPVVTMVQPPSGEWDGILLERNAGQVAYFRRLRGFGKLVIIRRVELDGSC